MLHESEEEFLKILEVAGASVALFIMFAVELVVGIVKKTTASRWARRNHVNGEFIEEAAKLGWINQRGWYEWSELQLRSWVDSRRSHRF